MRRIVLLSLFALLVAEGASAQRRGEIARGFARGGAGIAPGFVPGRAGFNRGRGMLPYVSGYGYALYDDGASSGYVVQQPVFLLLQPAPPPVVEPPPAPARPVVTDYKWPVAVASAPSADQPQSFGIVLKDGSTLSATTVTASDGVLHYVDPDERHMRISMRDVDRSATLKLNRERKLILYLPAPQ